MSARANGAFRDTGAEAVIRREHRNLGAVLDCLEALVDEVELHGARPDVRAIYALIDYLESFLDRLHHPKEDRYLFPALRRRHPDAELLLESLEHEHREGERLLAVLRDSVARFESSGGGGDLDALGEAARAYARFERAHAGREERELMPLARSYLRDEDWVEIGAAFGANEDPLFGEQPRREYRHLLVRLATLVPAPHGFAAPWPPRAGE